MGFFDKAKKGVVQAAASGSKVGMDKVALTKLEAEKIDLSKRLDIEYIRIGKRITEFLREGGEIADPPTQSAFNSINKLDTEIAKIEAEIQKMKAESLERTETELLLEKELKAEQEIEKLKQLLVSGVYDQAEYDMKVATITNQVTHFKKLRALEDAYQKKLIDEVTYKTKKAQILGQNVVE